METEISSVVASFGDRQELTGKGQQEKFSGDEKVFLDRGSGYTELYICQNSSNCTIKNKT